MVHRDDDAAPDEHDVHHQGDGPDDAEPDEGLGVGRRLRRCVQLERGQRATEVLKQDQFTPLSLAEEVVVIYALTGGLLDDVPVAKVRAFEGELRKFLGSNNPELMAEIEGNPVMTPELQERVRGVIQTFKDTVPY